MIVRASLGRSELLTKTTARTGKVYLFTASATELAAIVVAKYLLVKSITGFSVSLIGRFARGKTFCYLQAEK